MHSKRQASTEPALVVYGTPVDNAIRTIGGRPYVDLEAIAKALNLSIRRSSSVIVLEANTKATANRVSSATITGNLSYYFNRNYGNKPDVGAKVYLIDGSVDFLLKEEDYLFVSGEYLVVARNKEDKTTYRILSSTSADGNGHFELNGVTPGKYTLVAISSHARGKSPSEILGKVLKRLVDVQAGSTTDVSHDFGMTYY